MATSEYRVIKSADGTFMVDVWPSAKVSSTSGKGSKLFAARKPTLRRMKAVAAENFSPPASKFKFCCG